MKSKEESKEKESVNIEEHKEVIERYLKMNGLSLKSLAVTQISTGQVYIT